MMVLTWFFWFFVGLHWHRGFRSGHLTTGRSQLEFDGIFFLNISIVWSMFYLVLLYYIRMLLTRPYRQNQLRHQSLKLVLNYQPALQHHQILPQKLQKFLIHSEQLQLLVLKIHGRLRLQSWLMIHLHLQLEWVKFSKFFIPIAYIPNMYFHHFYSSKIAI